MQLLAEVNSELDELDRVESALGVPNAFNAFSQNPLASNAADLAPEDLTIQQMALFSLDIRREHGGTAQQVMEYIEQDFQRSLERTSLSPQLSRLRKSGKLAFVEGVYFITELGAEYIQSVFQPDDEDYADD